jgi:O-antigen ligase
MFQTRPLTGIGYRRFGPVHGLVAHNAFVHVLGELGMVGATAFVAMFYWYFVRLAKVRQALHSLGSRLRQDFADSGAGMLVCMCFLSRQYVVVPYLMLALGACFCQAAGNIEMKPMAPQSLRHLVAITSLTVGLLLTFYLMSRLLGAY